MNKSDIMDALEKKHNLKPEQVYEIVNIVFNGFSDTLKNGGRIEIRGFGSFSVKEYCAYEGRNPKTGNKVVVKPKKLPVFKVGKELKEMVEAVAKWKTFRKGQLKKLLKKKSVRGAGALVEAQEADLTGAMGETAAAAEVIERTGDKIAPQVEKRSEDISYARSLRGSQRFGG